MPGVLYRMPRRSALSDSRPVPGVLSHMPGYSIACLIARLIRAAGGCLGSCITCFVCRPIQTRGHCLGCLITSLGYLSRCLVGLSVETRGTCLGVARWEGIGPPASPNPPLQRTRSAPEISAILKVVLCRQSFRSRSRAAERQPVGRALALALRCRVPLHYLCRSACG
jgi:hypothetical protein